MPNSSPSASETSSSSAPTPKSLSEFTDWLRRACNKQVYLNGYANGDMGYLPTRAAYAEGGYEVEVAHLFYGGFRPKPGDLELLAQEAIDLLRSLETP